MAQEAIKTMKLDLTEDQIRVVLRALAVVSTEAQHDSRDSRSANVREYYDRLFKTYDAVYTTIHNQAGGAADEAEFDRMYAACDDTMDRP